MFIILGTVGISSAYAITITLSGTTIVDGTIIADNYFDTRNTQTGASAIALGGNSNNASGVQSIVGGGFKNTASENHSTVGGGFFNTASKIESTVGGGSENMASGVQSTVGGGNSNNASGGSSTVGGGFTNTASELASTVGGGDGNMASGSQSTVGGGFSNTAGGSASTVGGGDGNMASGSQSTVGGGQDNIANATHAVISGGLRNIANVTSATVGGGTFNTASGSSSTIPGGNNNQASGDYSFASGRNAKAIHDGTFVFADSSNTDFESIAPNTFTVRATNGFLMSGPSFLLGNILVRDDVTVAQFDRESTDGKIVSFTRDNVEKGSVSISGEVVSYNAFTGSHYAWTNQDIERGFVVSMSGNNKFFNGNPESEILYGIKITNMKNDPAILGTYLSLQEPNQESGENNPHLIMSEGNGEIWISDMGQDIHPGDYLISSAVPGHAMKDDRSEEVSHIIGRAAESIVWNEVTESVNGIKHKKVSILFNSFGLNNQIVN